MGKHENVRPPQAGKVCPACHKPVTEKITRHRTMGICVPLWKPGPCHNPNCPKCVPQDNLSSGEREELAALRWENRQLREELITLKRATPTD
ncbi:hypothetical protein SSPS47_27015 [Streptomyces sp. S4.7]|uniref:hypothetical protein n=1 Tax=Streptomyces sp. S4.7 TaxID=2705439 RepID=UPI0013973F48|nr:hypothetical protein [Streptomyces sp. S4.7]QHY98761.1 hypothetical protein SSPS47_27015 [Streptomyces sp. S4.7]